VSKVLVLSRESVLRHLSIADCIPIIDRALRDVASGGAIQPIRTRLAPPDLQGALGVMPGYVREARAFGIKVVAVFESNFVKGLPSHRGAVLLFDASDGALKGIFDAGAVTAVRTAAASAVATRALANPEAQRLAVLGYGEQALAHVEAMLLVRPVRRVTVWGRSSAKATEFAAKIGSLHGVEARAESSADAAVAGAEIICTTTAAKEPILQGDAISAGCHVNLVGSSFPDAREVDGEVVARSRFFADDKAMVEALGGEFREAVANSRVHSTHLLGSIGDVLNGAIQGRRNSLDITVFKSVGLIAEDLAAVTHLYATTADDTSDRSVAWVDL
jgi:ornithine cyclodeaminase/alanine dehydrogenase-like protein (mu-crystallin family)